MSSKYCGPVHKQYNQIPVTLSQCNNGNKGRATSYVLETQIKKQDDLQWLFFDWSLENP